MHCHPDLLEVRLAPVVPQHPPSPFKDRKGLVAGVGIPLTLRATDDRIGRMPLPPTNAIPRSGQPNLRRIRVRKPNVKHVIPLAMLHDLAPRDPVLLPLARGIG